MQCVDWCRSTYVAHSNVHRVKYYMQQFLKQLSDIAINLIQLFHRVSLKIINTEMFQLGSSTTGNPFLKITIKWEVATVITHSFIILHTVCPRSNDSFYHGFGHRE